MRNDERLEILDLLIVKMIHIPYRWGGDDPMAGFDCSGGILELLRSIGLLPSHGADMTAQSIYDHFAHKERGEILGTEDPTLGSLCFYGKSLNTITHIGMAIDGGELMFEFGGGGSTTTSVDAAVKQNAYGRIRPINHRSDLVSILRPLLLKP